MGLKKTEAEKKRAAEQRAKNRQGVKHAWRYLTDKDYYKKTKAEDKKKREEKKTIKEGLKVGIKKGDGSPADRGGLSVKQRTTAAKKHKAFKDNRAAMQKLRKEDPAAYRKKKKAQRKAANLAAMKAGSHTWD